MDYINKIPEILEKVGNPFILFALLIISILALSALFFKNSGDRQKFKTIMMVLLFVVTVFLSIFFGNTIKQVTGARETDIDTEKLVKENPSQIDPLVVRIPQQSLDKVENYIKSQNEQVTESSKSEFLVNAIGNYINYLNQEFTEPKEPVASPSISSSESKSEEFENEFLSAKIEGASNIDGEVKLTIFIKNTTDDILYLMRESQTFNVASDDGTSCDSRQLKKLPVFSIHNTKEVNNLKNYRTIEPQKNLTLTWESSGLCDFTNSNKLFVTQGFIRYIDNEPYKFSMTLTYTFLEEK
ncbi:MAG: hypothetical protein AB4057_07030 [Crocosphaera sp.]